MMENVVMKKNKGRIASITIIYYIKVSWMSGIKI